MNNHPNRNWRARMRQEAKAWLDTDAAKALIEIPLSRANSLTGLAGRVYLAWQEGYEAGRASTKK